MTPSPDPNPSARDTRDVADPRTDADVVGRRQGMFGSTGSGDTSGYGGLTATIAMPAASERPYGGYIDDLVDTLARCLDARREGLFDEAVLRVVVHAGGAILHIDRAHLPTVARTLRDEPALRFEMCLGVTGVHFPDATGHELRACYPLQSITHNRRVLLEVAAPDDDPHIPSLTRIYPTTDWHERETYDFFGLIFDGHPSLTRIEMPDDWEGHPQRKDYPLGGIPVQYKGATVPPPDQRRSYS